MSRNVLVDTNIIVAYFNDIRDVKRYLKQFEELLVPSIVVGELYFGAENSAKRIQNLQRVDQFIHVNVVLGCDMKTARQFGIIKYELKKKGRLIPDNDIWIAAIAIQHNLTLVSRDAHFHQIEALNLESC